MWQSTFLCNQFGNNHTDSEKSPDKVIYMNDIFSMKCNSSYALTLSLKGYEFPSKPLTAGPTVQPAALTTHLQRSLVLVIEIFAYEESAFSVGF